MKDQRTTKEKRQTDFMLLLVVGVVVLMFWLAGEGVDVHGFLTGWQSWVGLK